jgi:hypothetical protein
MDVRVHVDHVHFGAGNQCFRRVGHESRDRGVRRLSCEQGRPGDEQQHKCERCEDSTNHDECSPGLPKFCKQIRGRDVNLYLRNSNAVNYFHEKTKGQRYREGKFLCVGGNYRQSASESLRTGSGDLPRSS